ncbi:hypothetical protein [Neobacillus muris]|uniref:hypothetical protein n=1 Tax=Neobacillus muris TaxID=2941334 RepID=UPI002040C17E|nr:hypothetical protein [Neobacillus muris]
MFNKMKGKIIPVAVLSTVAFGTLFSTSHHDVQAKQEKVFSGKLLHVPETRPEKEKTRLPKNRRKNEFRGWPLTVSVLAAPFSV